MLEYWMLKVVWWLILVIIIISFTIMDGFDMGITMISPFIAKDENEKKTLINSVAATWEGNQVWLILAAGIMFAAWPLMYALGFSAFYLTMLSVLLALILRPVGFEFRNKISHKYWRNIWDFGLFLGGLIPSLALGLTIGNIFYGIPFNFDLELKIIYVGNFLNFFNPFSIFCSISCMFMFASHGSIYAILKTKNKIAQRAKLAYYFSSTLFIIAFILGFFWLSKILGYKVTHININNCANPFLKKVIRGNWLNNFKTYPLLLLLPILTIICHLITTISVILRKELLSFIINSITLSLTIATISVTLFPFLIPSSLNPRISLTIWDSSSSQKTLFIMLIAASIMLPITIIYTSWVYKIVRGKVTENYYDH